MGGARVTVLIKLDAEPGDYAMRMSSTSHLQNLHGYAILRYPVSLERQKFFTDMVSSS